MPAESRADQIRRERRWKPSPLNEAGLKLHLDQSKLDPEYHYRWAADRPDRIRHMKAYDYDVVPTVVKDGTNSLGTVNSVTGGVDEGAPYNMVLMRKHKVLFEDDQARKMKPLDDMDAAIRRGNGASTDPQSGVFYTPGQNQV